MNLSTKHILHIAQDPSLLPTYPEIRNHISKEDKYGFFYMPDECQLADKYICTCRSRREHDAERKRKMVHADEIDADRPILKSQQVKKKKKV